MVGFKGKVARIKHGMGKEKTMVYWDKE